MDHNSYDSSESTLPDNEVTLMQINGLEKCPNFHAYFNGEGKPQKTYKALHEFELIQCMVP